MTGDELGSGKRLEPPRGGAAQKQEGEAPLELRRSEPQPVNDATTHPPWNELMEEMVAPANIARAMQWVLANKGSPGIGSMSVDELPEHWR